MNKNKVIISLIILSIDQILKYLVQVFDSSVNIINNFFYINYYQNTGAAWSILEGRQTLLIVVSLLACVLVYSMMFSFEDDKLNNTAFGLLFGGILGNLFDRILFGYVRDFIDFRIWGYNFPIFNIADMAIVIGVGLIIISTIKGEFKNGNKGKRKLNKNR